MEIGSIAADNLIDFRQVVEIYEEALPPGERKPTAALQEMLEIGDYSIVAAKDGQHVSGFAVVFHSTRRPVGLLEYMATRPESRNRGLGQDLFRHALSLMGERVMLVEIEAEAGAETERVLQRRRRDYYLRMGCKLVEHLDYRMPQLNEVPPPALKLLYQPNDHQVVLSRTLLRDWIATIYSEVYGVSEDDPAIDLMIEAWAERAGADLP